MIKEGMIATQRGLQLLRSGRLNITHVVFGDGNGRAYQPSGNERRLKREVYRAGIAHVRHLDNEQTVLQVEVGIPSDVGGFWVREAGLYSENDELCFIAALTETKKELHHAAASSDLSFTFDINIGNGDVNITIDPSVTIATVAASRKIAEDAVSKHELKADPHSQYALKAKTHTKTEIAEIKLNISSTINSKTKAVKDELSEHKKALDPHSQYAKKDATNQELKELKRLIDAKQERGNDGAKGSTGNRGLRGLTGAKGDKGDKGDRGLAGTNGTIGINGKKGDKGDQGLRGLRGLTGPKGDKGDQGPRGLTGPKGNKGDQGLAGSSADTSKLLDSLVGLVASFHVEGSLSGWLDLKGGTVSRYTDSELWTYAKKSGLVISQRQKDGDPRRYAMYFGNGNGHTTFTLPNHHLGHFVRGAPSGVDHGYTQGDAIRNITGSINSNEGEGLVPPNNPTVEGAFDLSEQGPSRVFGTRTNMAFHQFDFDASRIVPTASENRPYTANLSIKIHRGWV